MTATAETAADVSRLAGLAFDEAQSHPPRSPGRRAASHLWCACTIPPAASLEAVRRAVASFGAPAVQAASLELLEQLFNAVEQSPTEQEQPA